jgi:hypothetical protein
VNVLLVALVGVVISCIVRRAHFDTTSTERLIAHRDSAGLPLSWEGLKQDTIDNFQVGFEETSLSKFVVESLRGYELSFLEDKSFYSLGYFLEKTGNTNVTTTRWSTPLKSTHSKQRLGTSSERTITYVHPVSNPLAPPTARATKKQRLERYGRKQFLVQTFTDVQDVPMADVFVVEERTLVETRGNKLLVSAYFRINFTKDSMFRSIIDKQTSQEFKEYFQNYKAFIISVAAARPETWSPTTTSNSRDDGGADTAPGQPNDKKRKGIRKFVGNQLGRFARMLQGVANKI